MDNDNKRRWVELFGITELFRRYYDNQATAKEKDAVESWDPENIYKDELDYCSPDSETEQLWNKIAGNLNLKIYRKRKKRLSIYKYSIAASWILFVFSAGYFIAIHAKKGERIAESAIVSNKNIDNEIKAGTNKAMLVLQDGSKIPLEKGSSVQTKNAQSNGKQIVYNSNLPKVNSDTITAKKSIPFNYLTIPRGGQFFIKLADGTKVWLNSESSLKYPVSFVEGETRKVELLYGEAYFEVSPATLHKGGKFRVVSSIQNVEVLGTKFNIKSYKDESDIYTTLVEGKVEVSTKNAKEVLTPNQQSVLSPKNNKIAVKQVDIYNVTSWIKGVFSFKATSLKDIMMVLSRWYNVEVKFENHDLENVKFNGVLKKDQPLEEILTILQTSKSINGYENENGVITIK